MSEFYSYDTDKNMGMEDQSSNNKLAKLTLSKEQKEEITTYLNQEDDDIDSGTDEDELPPLPAPPVEEQVPLPQQEVPEFMCRICHGEIELPGEIDDVIAPCRCSGSSALVHVECFNEWGRERCEICHFRFYAGVEPPPQMPDLGGMGGLGGMGRIPDDPEQRAALLNQMIQQVANTVPDTLPGGYRIRIFFVMIMEFLCKLLQMADPSRYGRLRLFGSLCFMWVWHINEIYRVGYGRMSLLMISITYSLFGFSAYILSPFLFIYHQLRNRPLATIMSLIPCWLMIMTYDLILHLSNNLRGDMYYQTAIQSVSDVIYGPPSEMCYSEQQMSPALSLHTIPYQAVSSLVDTYISPLLS